VNRLRRIRLRPALGLLAAVSVAGLAAAFVPAAPSKAAGSRGNGCASLSGVKAFHGHAVISFKESATGKEASGGTDTIALKRSAASLQISLTKKKVLGGRYVWFTGKASGGHVVVDDTHTFTTQGGTSTTATLSYNGPVSTSLPNLGATLIFDPVTCKYLLVANFAVKAKYGGDEADRPNATVTGSATSERHHVPANLYVVGGDGPDAGGPACKDPVATGEACYRYTGGWSVDFTPLFVCHSLTAGKCEPDSEPTGTAHFVWTLFPTK
jgi:hypothetical protein